jgi:hypothetical protein
MFRFVKTNTSDGTAELSAAFDAQIKERQKARREFSRVLEGLADDERAGRIKAGDPQARVKLRQALDEYENGLYTAMDPAFFVLERDDGKRYVIQPFEGGYHVWEKGMIRVSIDDPAFRFKDGDKIDVGGQKLTMRDAITSEIEKNARGANGRMMEYHHSATFSAAMENLLLTEMMEFRQKWRAWLCP